MAKILLSFLSLFVGSTGFILQEGTTSGPSRHSVGQIYVSNGGDWGAWGNHAFCPVGTFAAGYDILFETYGEENDNTALNGIKLYCHSDTDAYFRTGYVTSYEGIWGVWMNETMCPSPGNGQNRQFLSSFDLMVQPQQGGGDDTAANFIKFGCRTIGGPTSSEQPLVMDPPAMIDGSWSNATNINHCPQGTAICGLKTKVEPTQLSADDTALNDVVFFCCDV